MSRSRFLCVVVLTAQLIALCVALPATAQTPEPDDGYDVLVFHRTTGFRHQSIPAAIAAIEELGDEHGFAVTDSQDAELFTDEGLRPYEAIVFLTDGEGILNASQRTAFERYTHRGGGYVGIHSASNMHKTDWPWYAELLGGAFFRNHPSGADQFQTATLDVEDGDHPSTDHLGATWEWEEEWYNFTANPREAGAHVLLTVDESTYRPGSGAMGEDHPIAWCSDYDGGRAWYTALGHHSHYYDDADFRAHILGGIEYAAGVADGDCGEPREGPPTDAAFDKVALDDNTENPMELAIAPDGRVIYIELAGTVKVYHPEDGSITTAAQIPVHRGNENGLLGITLDPDFADNGWVYLFYSNPDESHQVQRVSRFTMDGSVLDMASESILLEIPHQREVCCHSAGSMAFGPDGNLFISTGDDSQHAASNGFAPIDGRLQPQYDSPDAQRAHDARRTSGNTNDLRGKILRITPTDDGGYEIPEGNLFPVGESDPDLTRPEIYTMGHRNPFRIAIDQERGWVYNGEVGPDARQDNPDRGPRGYDEFNQIREAGNYGWPFCIADNKPYVQYDWATGESGEAYDCENGPVNDSPHNTGLDQLPPAQDAWIYYPYGVSPEFPELPATNSRTAYAGAVFHHDPSIEADGAFPAYYDDTVWLMEWSRNWIASVRLDENGNYDPDSFEEFMPNTLFRHPHDMAFGPDGNMYLIEWGLDFNYAGAGVNEDSGLYKISYAKDGRTPVAEASADVDTGGSPLTVAFSSEGSSDADGDELTYTWNFGDGNTSNEANPTHTFTENGVYTVQLTVTDPTDRSSSSSVVITVGNTRPTVTIDFPSHGGFFTWGDEIPYRVTVTDPEDGDAVDCALVRVQTGLYHDEGGNAHVHPGVPQDGCRGTISIPADSGHNDTADIAQTVSATYTDAGGDGVPALTGGVTHLLQPKDKQAEYTTDSSGVTTIPAGGDDAGDAITGQDGAYAGYAPMDLYRIDEVTLRAGAFDDTTVELRRDAPDGELVGVADVPSTVEVGRVDGPTGFGSALRLNGDTPHQYVDLPDGVTDGLEEFTIAAWVNRTSSQGQQWARLFDFGVDGQRNMSLTVQGSAGPRFAIRTQGGANIQDVNAPASAGLPVGTWTHVAVTYSGTTATILINGEPVASNENITHTPADLGATTNNYLGRSAFSDPMLNAAIDDFHVFDRALSAEEVQALSAAPADAATGGNVLRYDFDEEPGAAVLDSSGAERDGTVVLNEEAAIPFTDVTVDVSEVGATDALYLVFPGGAARVDSMHFSGLGAAGPEPEPEPECSGTVSVGGVDTGIVDGGVGGVCFSEALGDSDDHSNRGRWMAHVSRVTAEAVDEGMLTARQRATLIRLAARPQGGRR